MIRARHCVRAARATLAALALLAMAPGGAGAQTEVLTMQGNLPRLNYRDGSGNLLWALVANSVLWKLDGPFNAGVIVTTAAAPSSSITLNEGGVGIRSTGFPAAKLHVGTITSPTEPGEVLVDPGNPDADATIYAVNKSINTRMVLETVKTGRKASLRLTTPDASFVQTTGTNYTLRDGVNDANVLTIAPGAANNNAIVVTNGRIGLGVTNPTTPLELKNGAKVSAGGVWTNASSRALKHDIHDLTLVDARAALSGLDPVTYVYDADPAERQVGFVAEDVPELVATNDRKTLSPMDFVAVLTKIVQDQDRQLAAQAEQLRAQADELARQRAAIADLTAGLADLQRVRVAAAGAAKSERDM
ncbi:tail fiber domain-containing protein [Candidatus Binatia bacterium]|nr:tail fiber domain-containing protein [Candidatus Binatia bacterium]